VVIADATATWTAVAAIAAAFVAVFTAVTMTVTWMAYQHGRQQAGIKRSLKILRRAPASELPGKIRARIDTGPNRVRTEVYAARLHPGDRLFEVYVVNFSETDQILYLGGSRMVWPLFVRPFEIDPSQIHTQSRTGQAHVMILRSTTGLWQDDRRDHSDKRKLKRKCWLRIRGQTMSGHRVRFVGRITMWHFDPKP
jgi:hypothetical protein